MTDTEFMQVRIETAPDIVTAIMRLVFIAQQDYEKVNDAVAAALLHLKFNVCTVGQIKDDIVEMREYSNKGSLAVGECIHRIGRRYGLVSD